MLRSEFEVLTGIYVTDDLYACIEEAYMTSKVDKREFCEAYKSNLNGIAQSIQQNACYKNMENRKEDKKAADEYLAMIKGLKTEINRLEKELEKEQGWEEIENSAMSDVRYAELAKDGSKLTDEEAAQLIADEFGFRKDRIDILHGVGIFEKNKHSQIRKAGAKERRPVYMSTDWNYVRFNVRGNVTMMYEMVNGELELWSE